MWISLAVMDMFHYLDRGDGFLDAYIGQNIKFYTLNMRSLLYVD